MARRQYRLETFDEVRRIAALRIFQPRQRLTRDRSLGETLEDEVVDLAALGKIGGGLDAVVGEA
jgi:hypothetical protein